MTDAAEPEGGDFWQQGGNPALYIMVYLTTRARDRALDLDQRTVYRKNKHGGLEEVAVFKKQEDAAGAVLEHNEFVQERKFKHLHTRLGDLIDRVDSRIMGDPII